MLLAGFSREHGISKLFAHLINSQVLKLTVFAASTRIRSRPSNVLNPRGSVSDRSGFGIGMPLASRDGIFFSLARLHVPQAGAKCIHAMLKCSSLINCVNESTSDCFVKSKIAMWAPLHLSQVLSTDKLRKPASRAVMDKRAVPANTSIIRISLIGLPENRLNECCETEFGVNEGV